MGITRTDFADPQNEPIPILAECHDCHKAKAIVGWLLIGVHTVPLCQDCWDARQCDARRRMGANEKPLSNSSG
jgi:hypothetical protein